MNATLPVFHSDPSVQRSDPEARRSETATGSRAYTLVEVVVAVTLGSIVLVALLGLFTAGDRMNRASQSTAVLQSALILEEAILQDIRQLGIDPARKETLLINEACVSFYKVAFSGEEVKLRPVLYERMKKRSGLYFLKRTEVKGGRRVSRTFSQAPLGQCRFSFIGDRDFGNRYLRVDFTVLESERVSAKEPDRSSTHSLVLRIPTPSGLGDPRLHRAVRLRPETDLIPISEQ